MEKLLDAWGEKESLLIAKVSTVQLKVEGDQQKKEWSGWEIIYILSF